MKQYIPITVAALIFFGLNSFKLLQDKGENITLSQKGNETEIQNEAEIQILREKFSIRFSNKAYNSSASQFYSTQIAAFLDKSELSKINTGMPTGDIPCFEPGAGMAPSSNGFYESIIFNNEGHHYLYFANKKDRRVDLISEENGMLRLEFPVTKLFLNEQDVKLEKTDINEFHLAILIDRNLNDVVDEGELTKVTIRFK